MGPLLALLVTFGLMWALLILPQQRRMRQHQQVVASLEVGDEIVTAGGLYGTITSVDDETLAVEVAPGIVLRVLRSAVSQRIAEPDEEPENTDVTAAPGIEEDEI
jgi:preprotein translocase subunit YajC